MPRFVVLKHEHPRGLHWDFMLEAGEHLATWALPEEPTEGRELTAEMLPDHRRAYLDYEGPVSGDRGRVWRWDSGAYEAERQTDDEWVVNLSGEKLRGRTVLTRIAAMPGGWRFRCEGG